MIGIAGEKCNGLWLPFILPVVAGHILERRSVRGAINLSWVIGHCWVKRSYKRVRWERRLSGEEEKRKGEEVTERQAEGK